MLCRLDYGCCPASLRIGCRDLAIKDKTATEADAADVALQIQKHKREVQGIAEGLITPTQLCTMAVNAPSTVAGLYKDSRYIPAAAPAAAAANLTVCDIEQVEERVSTLLKAETIGRDKAALFDAMREEVHH